jgi:hypothetical protein
MSRKSKKSQSVAVATPVVAAELVPHNVLADIAEAAALPEPTPVAETPAPAVESEFGPVVAAAPVVSKARKYPREGGKCWAVWNACDKFAEAGEYVTVKRVREHAAQQNWNLSNASQEFYAWKKFRSIA